jgi:peptidoglycan/LPS O-acetylase OafA/YrhL
MEPRKHGTTKATYAAVGLVAIAVSTLTFIGQTGIVAPWPLLTLLALAGLALVMSAIGDATKRHAESEAKCGRW